ncbi:MAG: hypothetical protein WB562_04710 [Candidatus Sulfotelmatobacter sp.]
MSVVAKPNRNVVTPNVYGGSPFQHEATAEPSNTVIVIQPARAIGFWQYRIATIEHTPALPRWMNDTPPTR